MRNSSIRVFLVRNILAHGLRCAYAQYREPVSYDLSDGDDQRQPRLAQDGLVDEELFSIIVAVKFSRQFLQIEGHQMRGQFARRDGQLLGKIGEAAQ